MNKLLVQTYLQWTTFHDPKFYPNEIIMQHGSKIKNQSINKESEISTSSRFQLALLGN